MARGVTRTGSGRNRRLTDTVRGDGAGDAGAGEPSPVEIKPAEVKPAEITPTEVKLTEIKPVEVSPIDLEPVAARETEIRATVNVEYDEIDRRLLETFPASDAVAHYGGDDRQLRDAEPGAASVAGGARGVRSTGPGASPEDSMTDLSAFPITRKWPAAHPDRIQLYSLNTPNGVKASIMLEETGLPYEPHLVRFDADEQKSAEFRSLNPYGKIPAIIDPDGPGGKPLPLFESGAILIYLADKSGRFLAPASATRYETLQWLMFQIGGIGPMFGQIGFFHKFAGRDYEDKRPRDRYVAEAQRLLEVLDGRLAGRRWIMGDDYTIADIATFGWVRNLIGFYGAGELVGFAGYTNVRRVLDAFLARPAVVRGLEIPRR
jgi:GST-like protein